MKNWDIAAHDGQILRMYVVVSAAEDMTLLDIIRE
jgi:hypothetical protein